MTVLDDRPILAPAEFLDATPERRRRILLDHLTRYPERHDQDVWAEERGCGTVACVAGWTCFLAGDMLGNPLLPAWAADRVLYSHATDADGVTRHISERAMDLLGLSFDDDGGSELFGMSNGGALAWLEANSA